MNEGYFKWLTKKVGNTSFQRRYSKLLKQLFETSFTYTIELDENRMFDGLKLRSKYAEECRRCYDHDFLDLPCSILEMMVALAIRAEVHIMDNPDYGDRTGNWFWEMIVSLGLSNQTNQNYNNIYVSEVLDRFLKRKYSATGKGGLFTIPKCKVDLRTVEIWWQMNWYMTWYLKREGEL